MCGIVGWIDWNRDLTKYPSILENMTATMAPRGPDATGTWLSPRSALGHRRLSVIDPDNGAQPMYRNRGDQTFTLVYNGELYNANELKSELLQRGYQFKTKCDTEVLLYAYMEWQEACVERLNGIFAFAVWDDQQEKLFMARDRLGVKPLFYSPMTEGFLFASEPKGILAHPDFAPVVKAEGLAEVFIIGPARTPGHGIFNNMFELKPGYCCIYDRNGTHIRAYWELHSDVHTDDADTTAAKLRDLLKDTVSRQLVSDVPISTLLSGGLDSSALTALSIMHYNEQNLSGLKTFSVDYVDNDKNFKESIFQPNADGPWVKRMVEHFGTEHSNVVIDYQELADTLNDAMRARDFPGMADVDSSLFVFCREIKKDVTVALSGDAADEIFGGYPWFYREESLQANTFPWALKTKERVELLSNELTEWIKPEQYVLDRYQQALNEVPRLRGEDPLNAKMREMFYLNITRFMPTLLDRKDRMSMAVGLEVRVPFCDHRLVEYVWNIPWEIKSYKGREKGILRYALEGILPEDVLYRKKSPYPKTHDPSYHTTVRQWALDILNDPNSPILPFINVKRIKELAEADTKFNLPWFGQLMTGPQYFAHLVQVNSWLKEYQVVVK